MGYQHALQGYIAATNTHQFDEVSKWLSPDAVYWFTGTSCTTPEEIRAYFEGIYQGEPAYGKGRATNVFVAGLDGEWKLIHEHLSLG